MQFWVDSPYLVGFTGGTSVQRLNTQYQNLIAKKEAKEALKKMRKRLFDLQSRLIAEKKNGVLIVFQAMDAAGKDSTIREVFRGLNPLGCGVHSFGKPSAQELSRDYLWRVHQLVPQKGQVTIFNRSHYEEVLVVRVFPELLEKQCLPTGRSVEQEMSLRYEAIRNFEKHLSDNGTVIIKFWLNVGLEEQKRRLLRRMNDPNRYWKHDPNDLNMRDKWADFMVAYEALLNETSRPWAPWYAIPADDKANMRLMIGSIVEKTLLEMNPQFPQVSEDNYKGLESCRARLSGEQR